MKILDNHARYNHLVVSQGLRVSESAAASSYVRYRKLEKRVRSYTTLLLEEMHPDNNSEISFYQYKAITKYVEDTVIKVLTRLDRVKSIFKLEDYMRIESTNKLMYDLSGRNVEQRIKTMLS